ncbi:hypothetical protein BGZ70_006642 [Mortierella alpina]|uniref:Uncharacterized protein n=1 Tax=Mortierella alpina TaxID=64518 RepID=A0A9P6M6S9_MORAP|nr:hypothetical protein BGZ70_006642 [Mortierella alpina]
MKFSSAASFLGALSLSLTFAPSLVQACEHECRVNVSHAFADKYQQLSSNYFTLLSQRAQDQIFHGIPVQTMGALDKDNAIKLIQDAVTRAQNTWDVTIYPTVFNTIFIDKPPFKGDCNAPFRVKQPPLGVNWTMSDCHKMDYICGNPPSICHFMPMIKDRIGKKLIAQLRARVGGVDSDLYINFLRPAVDTLLMQEDKFSTFQVALRGNLNQVLESFQDVTDNFANEDQWSHDWDMEIKTLLLTFP